MHGIAWDEDQITGLNSPGFLADAEPALAFQYLYDLIVIGLDVDDISASFENVDVARDVLSVK